MPVPAERTNRYAGMAGKEALFGIRPEHLTEPKNLGRQNIAQFELAHEVLEPMGMETLVHLRLQSAEICSRIDPTTPAEPGRPLQPISTICISSTRRPGGCCRAVAIHAHSMRWGAPALASPHSLI